NITTCTVLFTVVDGTPPVILSSPGLITLSADANCQAPVPDVLSQILATDNCTPANQLVINQNPIAGTPLATAQSKIALADADAPGNTLFKNVPWAVADTIVRTILSSPAPITVSVTSNCQGSVPDVLSNIVATDNCTPANQLTMTQNPAAGTLSPSGQSIITV